MTTIWVLIIVFVGGSVMTQHEKDWDECKRDAHYWIKTYADPITTQCIALDVPRKP